MGSEKQATIKKTNIVLVSLLMLLIAAATVAIVYTFPTAASEPVPLSGYGSAAVSSDGTPCAQIAVDILQAGGTAADGAIAAMLCSGVVNPQSMGIGGGFLLTYYNKTEGRAYTLNAREMAPAAAHRDMYHGDPDLSLSGGLAVAVPVEFRGYIELYERFGGGVPWPDILAPIIELCEEGYPVSWHLANALQMKRDEILAEPSLSIFVSPESHDVLMEGDILYQLQLGSTFRVLQEEPESFYTGSIAIDMVDDLDSFDGIITLEDLANVTAEWKEAVQVTLQNTLVPDTTLYTVPTPGTGAVLGLILNVLDEYDFVPSSLDPENEVLTYQRITEAFKYAYADRTYLGDMETEEMDQLVANMTSEAYARAVRDIILEDSTSQDPSYYGAYTDTPEDHGTSHVSVMADNGDAVAATSTINHYFGAKIASTKTGIIFNNEMDDFSSPNVTNYFGVPPSPANFISPGKRPLSSMNPSVLVSSTGEVRMVIGAAGGTRITTAVALSLINNLWFGMTMEDAVTEPRIHHQLVPMVLGHELKFSQTIISGLEAFNHSTEVYSVSNSVVSGVSREADGLLYAAADYRKSGEVDGY